MYRAVIIEDQIIAREVLMLLLNRCASGIISVIGYAESVSDAVSLINKEKPDVVFMDVNIKGGNSFDVLNKIEYKNFHLIFATGFEEYAITAFKYSAIDYLLKPFDIGDLQKAIAKLEIFQNRNYKEKSEQIRVLQENVTFSLPENKKLILSTHKGLHIIPVPKIIRAEASGPYTIFSINNNLHSTITVSTSIGEYSDLLSSCGFIRIHQSHLINIEYLQSINNDEMALLSDGSIVPISHRKKKYAGFFD